MLRVTTIHASSAGASARYYTQYLAAEGPEGEGQWRGRQADGLGLAGPVSTEDLEALLSGHDPVSGTRLGTALHDRLDARGRLIPAVAGFDATFSAPKSVSVLWALTGDPGVVEAHDVAVAAVLDHLERYGSTTRVRAGARRLFPDTGGLVMAAFGQATSREDDPQLHTHVVISAKVRTADGRWLALDARYLKRKQRMLGGLYQSVLRAELSHRFGVAWGPIEHGQAELAGMPAELLAAFSKRSVQVEEALVDKVEGFRAREGRDPTRWERAALAREAAADTRGAKSGAATSELAPRWREEAAAVGWTPERLVAALRRAARALPVDHRVTVDAVLDRLSAAGSTWGRGEVVQALCDLAPPLSQLSGRGWAVALEQAADRMVAACASLDPPDTTGVAPRASDGRSPWVAPIEAWLTSEAVLAQEERILCFALYAQREPERPSDSVERAGLDVLQAAAASAVAGEDPLVVVVGPAGAGKTTTLRRAVEDLGRQGRTVFGVAPTAKAAKVLRDEAGMAADTVAKLLVEWGGGRPPAEAWRLPAGTTLVLDEAGMVGTATLDRLVALVQGQGWRLVLVGDPRQLQAVGRGGLFEELCRAGPVHELARIHRFRHRWEREASLALRAGRPEALDAYLAHDRVSAGSFDDVSAEAARRWVAARAEGKRVAVVAETNDHVEALNRAVQNERRRLGHLGERSVRVAASGTASVGDLVVTRRNDRTLRTDRGETVRNRERWVVTGVGGDESLAVAHEGGQGRLILPADYVAAHVRLGYAATAHGHQGDTVDVGIAVVTAATTHRTLYVGATRGREENRLLVVSDHGGHEAARDVLEQVLATDRADTPATTQRRHLAGQVPRVKTREQAAEDAVATARHAYERARQVAQPFLDAVEHARADLLAAEAALHRRQAEADRVPLWRRRAVREWVSEARSAVEEAEGGLTDAERRAEPHRDALRTAEAALHGAERVATAERLRERLEQLSWRGPARDLGRETGVEPPALGR